MPAIITIVRCGLLFVGADDEVVQALLGLERRVDRVEDIAGDQQHIRALGLELTQQPLKETGVFEIAFLAMQVLPKVPVGGVKQTQGELREEDEKEGSLPANADTVPAGDHRTNVCGCDDSTSPLATGYRLLVLALN